jgi:hypothetical protein
MDLVAYYCSLLRTPLFGPLQIQIDERDFL